MMHKGNAVLLSFFVVSLLMLVSCESSPPQLTCGDPAVPNRNNLPRKVFLFIHGWGGDEKETWGCFLQFLSRDSRLDDYAVLAYDYPTSLFGHSPPIEDISNHLEQWLVNCCSRFGKFIIVAHSTGGIVAKEYILNLLRRGQAAELKVELLFLIATPNTGSDLARWASYVPGIRSAQLKALGGVDERFLHSQLRNWSHHVEGTDWRLHPSQKKWIKPIVIYGTDDSVVSKDSAIDRFPFAVAVYKDHSSIVKPERPNDDVVETVIGQTVTFIPND